MTHDIAPDQPVNVLEEIQKEFPGWVVTREDSGRWSAVRLGWGVLYAQTGPQLQARLRRYGQGVTDGP